MESVVEKSQTINIKSRIFFYINGPYGLSMVTNLVSVKPEPTKLDSHVKHMRKFNGWKITMWAKMTINTSLQNYKYNVHKLNLCLLINHNDHLCNFVVEYC